MTLTKADIITEVMNENGYNRPQATETVEALLDTHQKEPRFRRGCPDQRIWKVLRYAEGRAQRSESCYWRRYDAGAKKGRYV